MGCMRMKAHKNQCMFLSIVLLVFVLLHAPVLNQDVILDKQFGIEEVYASPSGSVQAVMPILAEETLGKGLVYQFNWHLDTNSLTQEKIFPFDTQNSRCFDSLKWNGETVMIPDVFLKEIEPEDTTALYEKCSALDGDLAVTIVKTQDMQYQILTDGASYPADLPGLYHALAGVEQEHTIFLLFLAENQEKPLVRHKLKALEISKETGAAQVCNIKNVPSGLTDFLYESIDFVHTESGNVQTFDTVACILADKALFLHDRKSVYKIDLKQKTCKRIFSTIRSIPQAVKEQYSDITHTDIYGLGYYQGLFCLNLLAENGVGNDYFYIPFTENPVVYCRGTEDVSTMYLFPNCY